MQHIIITGNPVEGFEYVGPFDSIEEADAASDRLDDQWWIAPLVSPDSHWHVNVYERWRNYGGPEEGGWWFDSGTYQPQMSVTLPRSMPVEEVNQFAADLHDRLRTVADEDRVPEVHSTLYTGGRYTVQTDDKPGADWPAETPCYS